MVAGAAAGAVAGMAIATLDLAVIGRRFPAIRRLPPLPQWLDHLLFGAVVGAVLARRSRGWSVPTSGDRPVRSSGP